MISQAGSLLMDEKMQRRLGVALHKKNTFAGGLIESSNSDNDPDLQDSWVIVEKQRVRIVIPPLPVATKSPPPNPGPVQLRPVAREAEGNESRFPVETETCPKTTSVHEQKKIKSLAPKRVVQVTRKSPAADYVSTFPKPMKRDLRMELRNPDQIATSESHRTLGVSKTSKAIIKPRRLRRGLSIFTDQGMLLKQKLRALNLERKLQGAGGLSRWLASLGLGQFVRIFKRKGLGKVQLVNLTMKKLKDMGASASAVGPRRKLMHAIDCFCQPCLYKKHSGIHLGPS
ncbi:hypothetical protein TB2_008584 [Malus domestica]